MKKYFLVIPLLLNMLWFPISSYSSEYSFGVNCGLISSSLSGYDRTEEDIKCDNRQAFGGYGSISIKPLSFLILQFNLGYAMKGLVITGKWHEYDSSYTIVTAIHDFKGIYRYDYIDGPILAKFLLFQKSPVHLTFSLGASPSYLASARFDGYSDGVLKNKNEDLKDGSNPFDVGILLGTGLEKELGPGKITFDFRFSLGTQNIYEENYHMTGFASYNHAFYFLLGYEYKLQSK